jgi:two-component system response regulator AtoC
VGNVVFVGSDGNSRTLRSALRELPLTRRPSTTVVVVAGGVERLVTTVREAALRSERVIVITLAPIPDVVVDEVLEVADDLLPWDATTLEALRSRLDRWHEITTVMESTVVRDVAVGTSRAHVEALAQVVEAALYSQAPVLLMGETGTGKEVAARLLHMLGPRKDAQLVVVDSSTIIPTLSGSELFGHARGAFTGAESTRTGAFAAANGGTLLLDEIGELPLRIQAELLRVVQEGTYKPVGSNRWQETDFRLVCATNRDLDSEMRAGRFRRDLFHRIAANIVHLPPLRERWEDVDELFRCFLKGAMGGTSCPPVVESVSRMLRRLEYPGNLRDLRQVAIRVAARHAGPGPITLGDLSREDRVHAKSERAGERSGEQQQGQDGEVASVRKAVRTLIAAGHSLKEVGRIVADTTVELALEEAGSTKAAARRLGVSERAIQLRRAARRRDETADAKASHEIGVDDAHVVRSGSAFDPCD